MTWWFALLDLYLKTSLFRNPFTWPPYFETSSIQNTDSSKKNFIPSKFELEHVNYQN